MNTVHALGPLFGPDFITMNLADANGAKYSLEIFPDANNPLLRQNGLPTQFYYLPKQVSIARKPTAPADFDFNVTLFKGLMTASNTLGVHRMPTAGGSASMGGAFISFSTTMAVPDEVLEAARGKLAAAAHSAPPARIAHFFHREAAAPAPLLGIVPIIDNNVTLEVPALPGTGDNQSPWFLDAKGTGKGSIEASGISSFLVTCDQLSAGAIVGALKQGHAPFTVHYNLKLLFYINACDIHMNVDVDKVFTQFSGAVSANYAGFFQADLAANYQRCLTNGGIETIIQRDGANVDADIKKLIDKQVTDMQDRAWNLVKSEIFDWQPKPDEPAKASASACGGAAVNLKFNYQKRGVKFNSHFEINETVAKEDTIAGTLNDLEPAIQADLNKYLSIVDIGEYWKKLQVAATANIAFGDGEDADPISAALIEVSYPNYSNPRTPDGRVALVTEAEGFHYSATHNDQAAPVMLARWTKDNPSDIINISFLRLDTPVPEWDSDQVQITKKLIYKSDDPRVDLSTGGTTYTVVSKGMDHAPVIGPDEIGYVYIKFFLDRPIKAPNMTVTLTIEMGGRTDVLVMKNDDPRANPIAVWQRWSDKYFNEQFAKVKIDVEIAPPASDFMGAPVSWSGVQAIPLNLGRIKRIVPCKITLPTLGDQAQAEKASRYILAALQEAQSTSVGVPQ